jgi:hypothetical protein
MDLKDKFQRKDKFTRQDQFRIMIRVIIYCIVLVVIVYYFSTIGKKAGDCFGTLTGDQPSSHPSDVIQGPSPPVIIIVDEDVIQPGQRKPSPDVIHEPQPDVKSPTP